MEHLFVQEIFLQEENGCGYSCSGSCRTFCSGQAEF